MNRSFHTTLITASLAGALLAGCASTVPTPEQYSGYLKDYSGLQETTDAQGDPVLRKVVSPQLNPNNYNALIIEPTQFYPPPQPSEEVSSQTLFAIGDYLTRTLRQKVGQRVRVVEQPGPGVARLRMAVTSVGAEKEGLKPYQYIPIALVVTTASRAVSGTPEQAKLFVESEVTDSLSNQRLLIGVREGTGERLQRGAASGNVVTLDSLKPLIDRWAESIAEEVPAFIRAK